MRMDHSKGLLMVGTYEGRELDPQLHVAPGIVLPSVTAQNIS